MTARAQHKRLRGF